MILVINTVIFMAKKFRKGLRPPACFSLLGDQNRWIYPFLLSITLCVYFFQIIPGRNTKRDTGYVVKILTYNRLPSLQRLVSSLSKVKYKQPINIEFEIEGGAPVKLQEYVSNLSWERGETKVHNRVVKGGLIQAVIESWEPQTDTEAAIFLEDDIEVSPYFFNWLDAGMQILQTPSLGIPSSRVLGISLYTPRLIETVHPKQKIEFDNLVPNNVFLYQLPCSWGALYFPNHWRQFRAYMRHRLQMEDHVEVYGSTTNGWKGSWKKFMVEFMWINDLFMLYPNYQNQTSFATNHLEPGEHIKVNDTTHNPADFVVPLMDSPPVIQVSKDLNSKMYMVDLFGDIEHQYASKSWFRSRGKQECKHQKSWGKKLCNVTSKETILFDLNRDKYTVLLSMFDWKRIDIALRSIRSLIKSDKLDKILVTWHSQKECPPADIVLNGKKIIFLQSHVDSLNERFVPEMRIRTEAVLILDDDIIISHEDADGAFQAWQQNDNRLVGYFPRWTKDTDGMEYRFESENIGNAYGGYRIMLTKGMFLHKKYLYEYYCGSGSIFHDFVDKNMNGEDLAMNYVVANVTKGPSGMYFEPHMRIGDYGKFLSSGLQKRNKHQTSRSDALKYFTSLTGIKLAPASRIAKLVNRRVEYIHSTEVTLHHLDCKRTDFSQPCDQL